MTAPLISDSEPLLRFRANALRRSVALGWVILVVLAAQAIVADAVSAPRFLVTAGGFAVVLLIVSAINWQRLLAGGLGEWVAWAWAVLATMTLGSFALIEDMFLATQPIFSGIVVLTGLVLSRVKHTFVTVLAISLVVLASASIGRSAVGDLLIPALTVAVVAGATALLGAAFETESRRSRDRLAELQRQREAFERLYAVSATLAGAESLREGLPQLVGTICRYLQAQVGVVFLYQPEDHSLRVMSPIWVNTQTLEVDDFRIRVSQGGLLAQVFRSGRPIRIDHITANPDQYSVLGELGLEQALIAPLRVEGFNVGVMAVGDPLNSEFRDEQLDQLASLSAPAGLVLSQLGRYEAANEMTRRMQEVAQLKTDFVSVVSHELRTPLTSIIGSLDTVARPELAPPTDTARELIDSARRQAHRLQRLIEDLLIVSRLERRAVPINIEPVKVRPFLEEVADTVGDVTTVSIDTAPEDLVVLADPDHLGRVFINLLENAAKYAPGSPVEVSASRLAGDAVISIADHGDGIPDEEKERVFEAFTQLEESHTRTKGGTGLGLSLVKGLIEAMSGEVRLTDTPGGGATFTVVLPVPGSRRALGHRLSDSSGL